MENLIVSNNKYNLRLKLLFTFLVLSRIFKRSFFCGSSNLNHFLCLRTIRHESFF